MTDSRRPRRARIDQALSPLLLTKLCPPPVRPRLVHRPRLVERLNRGLYGKLTLVSAPAGFGKTTLVSEWLTNQERPVAWLSLDEHDNDPVQFLVYLTASIEHMAAHGAAADPSVAGIGQSVRDLLHSPQLPPIPSLVALLINELAALDLPLILVLDDYQFITQETVHDILQTLLERQPPAMHTVVCTRQDLPVPLPRLRARGWVTEVREPDLRFTEDEAADFFDRTMGLRLDERVVQALEGRTEGWIAGLQLAALALHEYHGDALSFVASFTGDDRYIMDYMLAEVLEQQPPAVRDFVRQTAILDRFTAGLCNAVTGRDDSQVLLERLEAANLFLVPLDHRREWYRYHRLFAEFLQTRLDASTRRRLHRRAMDAYQAALHVPGYVQLAIGHALAYAALPQEPRSEPADATREGGEGIEWADAERLIGLAAEETLHAGGVLTLRRWLDALPDERVRSNSELAVYKGWVLALTGEMPLAQTYADAAEAGMGDLFRSASAEPALGRLLVLRSWLAVLFHQDYARALELAAGALENLGEEPSHWRVLALWAKAESQERTRRITEAIATLREALRIGKVLGSQVFVATVEISLALALNNWGKRREAVAICQEALERYTDERGQLSPIAGLVLSRLAMLHYEANELDLARACHDRGMALSEQVTSEYNLTFFEGLGAPIFYAQGEVERALAVVGQGYQTAMQTGLVDAEWFLTREAAIRLQEGDLAYVERWAEAAALSVEDKLEYLRVEQHLLYARLLLARGRDADLRRWLARLERFTREHDLNRSLLSVYLLQALAADVQGGGELVHDRLVRVLEIAAPQDYVRALLDEGPRLLALLPAVRHSAPAFVDRVLEHADTRSAVGPAGRAAKDLFEPLSERELEVLRLIAAGLANREIADELYIAVGTVKRHINHIYGKLGVHSRTQALARARDLSLF